MNQLTEAVISRLRSSWHGKAVFYLLVRVSAFLSTIAAILTICCLHAAARRRLAWVRTLVSPSRRHLPDFFSPSTATLDVADFIYTCPSHLSDTGFARAQPDPPQPDDARGDGVTVTKEDIERVTQEWKERQKAKEEKTATGKGKEKEKDEKGKEAASPKPSPTPPASPAPPKHRRYVLDRKIFQMRQEGIVRS